MFYAGRLIVASPLLGDPNFAAGVALICAHDDEGAFGLVLNRPTDLTVAHHLGDWGAKAPSPAVVFIGGPVQIDVAIGLGTRVGQIEDWTAVVADVGLVDLAATNPEAVGAVRVFAGYAGWGAGQLEAEVGRGDWFVIDAGRDDVFTAEPDLLQRQVLRRQPGTLRLYADFPAEPRLN